MIRPLLLSLLLTGCASTRQPASASAPNEDAMKADEIRFLRGRLKFGGSKTGAPFPSVILVYRRKS